MGILNITPDSFSDGGIYYENVEKSVLRIREMLAEGADIIDIGGESTRPGSEEISGEEELSRVIPVITEARKQIGGKFPLSIDTNKSVVAKEALNRGAELINSLGGLTFDPKLANVISEFKCQFIIYHIRGIPRTMQKGDIVYKDIIDDIVGFFKEQIAYGIKQGINKSQFIIDPGIGFGKTLEQNLEIIRRLYEFKSLKLPILIGISRKSHLGKLLQSKLNLSQTPPHLERLEACLAETAVAILNGATIIRTHDIAQTKKFVAVLEEFL